MRLRTLDEVASECHVSAANVCRLFRTYDQQSPYQFLLRLKVNRAAVLLREQGGPIKDTARQRGFFDALHFSLVFRKILGVPPSTDKRARVSAQQPVADR